VLLIVDVTHHLLVLRAVDTDPVSAQRNAATPRAGTDQRPHREM
jgi:hypothetical protein